MRWIKCKTNKNPAVERWAIIRSTSTEKSQMQSDLQTARGTMTIPAVNQYIIIGALEGCRVYLCNCVHTPHCKPYCITASQMIAWRFTSHLNATLMQKQLEEKWPNHNWSIALVCEEPKAETVLLGDRSKSLN